MLVGLGLITWFLPKMLDLVKKADDVSFVLCNPRWDSRILKRYGGTHFCFVLDTQLLNCLELHADVPGLVDVLTLRWEAESDVLEVVFRESIHET